MRAPDRSRRFGLILLLALPVALIGCGAGDEAAHDHSGEEATLRLTGWSETAEAFLEHPPLWAGRAVGYMIHVTDQTDGRPRTEGAVTLRAVDGAGGTATVTAEVPVRRGVYAAVLALPTAGEWSLGLEVDGDLVDLGPVTVHADEESAVHAAAPAVPTGIAFLKEQQWRLGVYSNAVVRDLFVHAVRVPATVVAPPDRRAVVSSPLDGRLDRAAGRSLPLPGDLVTAGETLALIHPPFAGAVADAAAAEVAAVGAASAARLAAAELERVRALAADGAASDRRLQEAAAEADRAAADLAAARLVRDSFRAAGLDVSADGGAVRLSSPVSGVVTGIHASPGEQIPAGGPVFTVLDPSIVWLRGRVPEADMLMLGERPTAAYRLPGASTPPRALGAGDDLVYLSHEIDTATRTAPITFRLANDAGLRVGMAVELVVKTRREERALVVPSESLVDEDGKMVVFVQLDGETFEKRQVIIGGDDGRHTVIRSGLIAGERIVVSSPYSLLLAQAGTSVPAHGHAH